MSLFITLMADHIVTVCSASNQQNPMFHTKQSLVNNNKSSVNLINTLTL